MSQREHFGRTLSWGAHNHHDLYDFHRSSELVPLQAARALAQRSILQHNYKLMRHLEALGTRCIPRLLQYRDADPTLACNVLVTSPVGPSLNELLAFCGNQLTLRSVCLLALQLLDAIEELHVRDVVHAGITPTNIAIGIGEQVNQIFLLNFAHGRFFRDPRTHRPITTINTNASTDKARKQNEFLSFCSTFIQRSCTPAPRDDVIAIGYVLCYVFHGGLPWIQERQHLQSAEVIRQKMLFMDVLQHTPPIQLHYFLKSGYAMRQGEVADYSYLRGLIKRLMQERGWSDAGAFDWAPPLLGDKSGGGGEWIVPPSQPTAAE
jgi:casein kinase 1